VSIAQHPNDVPGVLTRGEVWSRISIGLLIGVSLAVAKAGVEREARGLRGLGSARKGWDAARRKQTSTAKTFKHGPYDDWTDEELWDKARSLIMGGKPGDYVFGSGFEGAWVDLDLAYSEATDVDVNCKSVYEKIARAVGNIRTAKGIFNTRRIDRFAMVKGYPAIDFPLLEQRVGEASEAYRRACHRGPDLPVL
jgi:hypothetical protein